MTTPPPKKPTDPEINPVESYHDLLKKSAEGRGNLDKALSRLNSGEIVRVMQTGKIDHICIPSEALGACTDKTLRLILRPDGSAHIEGSMNKLPVTKDELDGLNAYLRKLRIYLSLIVPANKDETK